MSEVQQSSVPKASPFLNTEEAASFLRIDKRTLVNWRSRGGGPTFRKHGGRVFYHIRDLDDWSTTRSRDATQ